MDASELGDRGAVYEEVRESLKLTGRRAAWERKHQWISGLLSAEIDTRHFAGAAHAQYDVSSMQRARSTLSRTGSSDFVTISSPFVDRGDPRFHSLTSHVAESN